MERRLSETMWTRIKTRILERGSALINTHDTRKLLTCDGGRVTIIRRACQMLSEGIVDDYLNPIRDSRWGVRPLGLSECETTHFGTLMFPKTTQAVLSREERKK